MKMITVSLSWECAKDPPCSFCYQKAGAVTGDTWEIYHTLQRLLDEHPKATVCFEYSGYNLLHLFRHVPWKSHRYIFTMTTMPQLCTEVFCGAVKATGISALAISYDSEKCKSADEWMEAGHHAHDAGLKVACNYLIEHFPPQVPDTIATMAHQVNLLVMKPTGKLNKMECAMVTMEIERLKANHVSVAVDNCLGVQLGFVKKCKPGVDFVHVMPDGNVEPCCFKERCFLWEKNDAD